MSGGCATRQNRSSASCAPPPGWAIGLARCWPGDADVFGYFNNDQHAAALYDAAAFASLVHRAGRQVTATPAPGG